MFLRSFALLIISLISLTLFAQAKDPSRLMSISYGSSSWNTDSKKIDSAYLIMRDKTTGKIVQIQLEETEPDSSEFSGQFSVNMGPSEKVSPEVFVPPSEVRGADRDNRKLYEMIKNDKLPRKPVIWKKNDKGQAVIDVYDTRDQAESALKAYQEQQKLEQEQKQKKLIKPVASETAISAAIQAEKKNALDKLAMEAAKRETDRVRLEQIEKQKAEERAKKERESSEKERAEHKAKAAKLNEEALAYYRQGNFVEAEKLFKQVVDLDPGNTSYYFKYGVTLYRNEKFNDALVVFKLAKVEPQTEMEKRYYMGLTFFRLGEIDSALKEFATVSASQDPVMAPSATFYQGVIYYTLEKLEPAKKAFEQVIDTSQSPRMDEQAEEYLERIANAMAFQKLREKKFTFVGIVGGMYDSNVLLAPDTPPDQGSVTDIADIRLLTIGDLEYRPIYSQKHEFTPHVNASLTNSLKDQAAPADPYLYNVNLPYSYKGVLGKKGFKVTAKPAYEVLYMAPSASASTKSIILNSYYVALDATIVMNPNYFVSYGIEYRGDDSRLDSSSGLNDADASKYSLRTSHSVFLDKARKEALVGSLAYIKNAAKGNDKKYNRIEAGVVYVRPTKWNASWNLGLNIYSLKYPESTTSRSDFNSMLSVGFSKPVRDWVTWGVVGSYTKNNSTDTTSYEYSKFMILTTATFVTNF